MIKRVYTTADFIEAGRLRNGDLYDYSRAVFNGFQNSVILGCKRCGKWITLKNAASHYMKGCGCKACNRDKLSLCKVCGVGVSSKVYHKQAKRCKACCDQVKADRAKRIEEKHGKHCRACGTWFVCRRSVYCSKGCSQNRQKKVCLKTCSYCGTQFERALSYDKGQRLNFCSVACQNAFQRSSYFQYQNETPRPVSKIRTRAARSKWYTKRRKERRKNSQAAIWWSKTQMGWKDTQTHEISGVDGGAIKVQWAQ